MANNSTTELQKGFIFVVSELTHLQAYMWYKVKTIRTLETDQNKKNKKNKSTRTRSRNSFFTPKNSIGWRGVPKRNTLKKFGGGRISRRKSVNIASAIVRTICSTCQTPANNEPPYMQVSRVFFFLLGYFIDSVRNRKLSVSEKCPSPLPRQENDSVKWRLYCALKVIIPFQSFQSSFLCVYIVAQYYIPRRRRDSFSKPRYRDAFESK